MNPVAQPSRRNIGLMAALLTPVLMGMAPVFGKLAIRSGIDAYTLAALRTCLAAALLWFVYGLFFRRFIYIFPAGLIGTLAVGAVNGLGSLLFYNALLLLDNASLAQLLNMMYVIFAMLLTRIYGHHISLLSIVRAGLALVAIGLLAAGAPASGTVHWLGVGLMLVGAFMYALHVVLSQRVMFEMPAPTMALYALTFMGATVLIARLFIGGVTHVSWTPVLPVGWWFILGLTAVTALSRVTLFAGVRSLGGLQTILLNMGEMAVTLLVAAIWLDERMTLIQWIGVAVLAVSVVLSRWDTDVSDTAYRPLLSPTPLGGLSFDFSRPLEPSPFGTVTRLYRRQPRTLDLSGFSEMADLADLSERRK
jgi:drug/metabolite transporter (DMT)-like permease